jgi:hypothetical protein
VSPVYKPLNKSKTDKGKGRRVPLSDDAEACLKDWRKLFPKAQPAHYVFCSEQYGLDGENGRKGGKAVPYKVDPTKPIGPFKDSWDTARESAGVEYTWHDTRHTFISELAESGSTDAEIMALAGHVSKRMLERYSHARNARKIEAIDRAFNKMDAGHPPRICPKSISINTVSVGRCAIAFNASVAPVLGDINPRLVSCEAETALLVGPKASGNLMANRALAGMSLVPALLTHAVSNQRLHHSVLVRR